MNSTVLRRMFMVSPFLSPGPAKLRNGALETLRRDKCRRDGSPDRKTHAWKQVPKMTKLVLIPGEQASPQPGQRHWNHDHRLLLQQLHDAAPELIHVAVGGQPPLGEDSHQLAGRE